MKKIVKDFDGQGKTRTFAYLWVATKRMFEQAEDEKDAQIRTMTMSCMLYCAFTLEAFLNHIGNLVPDQWDEKYGRKGPKEKMAVIEKYLETKFNKSLRPFQTFNEIFKYRNMLVHGRTEVINEPTIVETDRGPDFEFESDWKKMTTYDNAKRFFNDTDQIMIDIFMFKRWESEGLYNLDSARYSNTERDRLLKG